MSGEPRHSAQRQIEIRTHLTAAVARPQADDARDALCKLAHQWIDVVRSGHNGDEVSDPLAPVVA